MSEPKSSLEIMDVLSSIRRLVSEDRKGAVNARIPPAPLAMPAAPEEETEVDTAIVDSEATGPTPTLPSFRSEPVMFRTSSLPTETRFVLTAAHRVSEDTTSSETTDEATDIDEPAAAGQSFQIESSVIVDEVDPAETEPLADLSSLESTIAELEAAVAGIEAEFEPDGGDAEELAADPMPAFDPAPWRSESNAARPIVEYQGLMPSFERLGQIEEPLDTPITGELPAVEPAASSPSAFWRASAPVIPLPIPVPAPAAPALEMVSGETAEPRSEPMTSERVAENTMGADVAGSYEAVPAAGAEQKLTTASDIEPVPEAISIADEDEASPETDEGAETQGNAMRLHLSDRPPGRPVIVRSGGNDEVAKDFADLDLPVALEDDENEEDLFDPLASANIDLEALRDLVAEIVRDELRGTLGERITRNLRVLVRKEIGRALSQTPTKAKD